MTTPATGSNTQHEEQQHDPDAWPEPAHGTQTEAVKAALKAHRDVSRIQLITRETTDTGVALSLWMTWLLEVWTKSDELPALDREIVKLYFLTESGVDALGRPCQATDAEVGRRLGLSAREVGRRRRAAVAYIALRIWPAAPDSTSHTLN